jgi:hypothetical protein
MKIFSEPYERFGVTMRLCAQVEANDDGSVKRWLDECAALVAAKPEPPASFWQDLILFGHAECEP